jgi:hypothetical protein
VGARQGRGVFKVIREQIPLPRSVFRVIILKTAVAGPKMAHLAKITLAFESSVLTLTVPGLRAENFKILCAFNQLHHFGPP